MSSIVRPEFGDSLPTKLGPKWRALSKLSRGLIIGASVVIVALLAYILAGGTSSTRSVKVAAPVPFQLDYDGDLLQQRLALGRESLRLESPAAVANKRSFAVQPLLLPAYEGSVQGVLPLQAERLVKQMTAADPSFITVSEGPLLIEDQPGYEILYQLSRGGETIYGRRVLLFPAKLGGRAGVDVTMTAPRSSSNLAAPVIGQQPPLREPIETLVVGN